jgi:Winged helix-turn helix
MNTIARRKLSLLDLASEHSNVSRACKISGYSRQQFYQNRRNFQTCGVEGLLDRMPGARGPHPNRVAAEIETAILDHALDHHIYWSPLGRHRIQFQLPLPVTSQYQL